MIKWTYFAEISTKYCRNFKFLVPGCITSNRRKSRAKYIQDHLK